MNLNITKLRNNLLDSTINVLKKAKKKPDLHKQALDAILDNPMLNDEQKLAAMQDYFAKTVANMINNQEGTSCSN